MNFLFLCAFLIGIFGIKYEKIRTDSYMKKEQTSAINGFFVIIVFFRHFGQYITYGKYDLIFQRIDILLGQFIVTLFLFYSGYGIFYSLKNKESYLKSLVRRFFTVLVHFDIAIVVYLLLDICLNQQYSLRTILLSFIAWESIGNSNWYIFAMLCMYIITIIAGALFSKRNNLLLFGIILGCIFYIVLLKCAGKSSTWYYNILCFPAGMLYCNNIETINKFLSKKRYIAFFYSLCTFVCFSLLYIGCNRFTGVVNLGLYQLASISFCLFIISITLFFKIENTILAWLGNYVFEIYILQRIPMILFQNIVTNKYLYFFICLIITLIIAFLFKMLEKCVDSITVKKDYRKRNISGNNS